MSDVGDLSDYGKCKLSFLFGILAVVHKLYLSHVTEKRLQSVTNLAVQLQTIRIDFKIEV